MMKLNKGKIIFLIIVAIAVGAIYFFPNILIPDFYNQATGSNYSWRDMAFYSFEEMFSYGTSISDIMRGHFLGGDPFLWEYKDMPTTWDYYPLALIIGLVFKLFKFSDPSMLFVIGDFIFPPISFIIIFLLFWRITKIFLLSILSSLIFLYFPSIFIFRKILSADFYKSFSLSGVSGLFTDIALANSDFSRLFVPGLTMIFLGAFLLLSYYSISEKTVKKRWVILAGISYGLLFYVYFYYWVFITISLGLLSVFLFFQARDRFWRVTRIFLYGLIISIPYWIRFFVLAGNPIYGELAQRIGLFKERILVSPGGGYWAALAIFLLSGIIFFKRIRQNILFFYILSFLMSILIVRNLQFIFGFNPQPDHWGSRITIYFMILAVLAVIFWFLRNSLVNHKTASSLILSATIIFLLVIASAGQIIKSYSPQNIETFYFFDKDMRDSFFWINKNTEPDSVFLTDADATRTALAFYTHANTYLPHACVSLASGSEILERYREVYALYKVPPAMLEDFFTKNDKDYTNIQRSNLDTDFSMFCVAHRILSKDGAMRNDLPQNVIDEFMQKYKMTKADIKNTTYRADYLFYGRYERVISNFNADIHPELKLVYLNNSVKIYKIIK